MPRAFSTSEREAIRARLLEQGGRLFGVYGLQKTTVEEIARAAGISKAAFYLFHELKEALFLAVLEEAEQRFRRDVLAAVDRPGPTPRARLAALLCTAFRLLRTVPLLHAFTSGEYDLLARRVSGAVLQEHLRGDETFVAELIARCRAAGIPITASPAAVTSLIHALFFTVLHEDDLGPGALAGAHAILIELVAAYCLGEVPGPRPGLDRPAAG